MKQTEPLETRKKMVYMHDEMRQRLDNAMNNNRYVEASWICYAIFEQRITRIMMKHLKKCPKGKRRKDERHVGISTKIQCLKKLTQKGYGAYSEFDKKLLNDIDKWCKKRNTLVHDLVSLDNYKNYDKEFEALAKAGEPLVKKLYKEAEKIRRWCYKENNNFGKFPEIKCKCKSRCIYEEE